MSANLDSNKQDDRLDMIYSDIISENYNRHTEEMYGNSGSSGEYTKQWWDYENEKRRKIRYYYENYSLKKLIIDFFLIIITSGLVIFFFIYRHKKHKELRERVRNGEFREEDFKKDLDSLNFDRKDAKFLNKKI